MLYYTFIFFRHFRASSKFERKIGGVCHNVTKSQCHNFLQQTIDE